MEKLEQQAIENVEKNMEREEQNKLVEATKKPADKGTYFIFKYYEQSPNIIREGVDVSFAGLDVQHWKLVIVVLLETQVIRTRNVNSTKFEQCSAKTTYINRCPLFEYMA